MIVLLFLISSCADYKPVIDFRGSEKKGADLERYDDDLSSCKKLAEQTIPDSEHHRKISNFTSRNRKGIDHKTLLNRKRLVSCTLEK